MEIDDSLLVRLEMVLDGLSSARKAFLALPAVVEDETLRLSGRAVDDAQKELEISVRRLVLVAKAMRMSKTARQHVASLGERGY